MKPLRTSVRARSMRMIMLSLASLCLALSIILAGCGRSGDESVDGKVNVVTTFYPLYYMAQAIGGEDAHVVNLVPVGVEPHDWTPKSRDLRIASKAQLFIYNGAGLEGWTEGFLKGISSGSQLTRVEASRGIALIKAGDESVEEDIGHSAAENQYDHGDTGPAAENQHDHDDTDPHTWVSPKSAVKMAGNIRDAFVKVDSEHQAAYESRFAALADKLNALDAAFSSALAPYAGKDIVVSHQAFAYLCRDYGLHQEAIMGLSPEAEPRSQDILSIMKFIKAHQIKHIFFEQLASGSLAEMIAKDTGATMLVLNPVEGLTPEQEQAGEDYISLMKSNLKNLLIALKTN